MPSQQTYTVRAGDTLAEIADKFNVAGGYQAIATLNHIANPNVIHPGTKLKIPGTSGGGGGGDGGGGSSQSLTYTVKAGDTLAEIADRFDYPGGYQALAKANGITNPGLIHVGQKIKIRTGGGGGTGGNQTAPQQPQQDDGGSNDAPISGENAWIGAAVSYNQQRGYSKATWRDFQSKIGTTADGVPGKMTARAVYRWQASHALHKDGQLGPKTAKSLGYEGGGSQTGGGGDNENEGPSGGGGVNGLRQRILDIAHSTLSSRTGHHYYSQPGALTDNPLAKSPLRSDCSQWVRAVYLQAGAGDPGTYTGAMVGKAKKTSNPIPGDIMLKSGHVELYIGNGETIGHGSPPIDKGTTSYWKGRGMYYATYDFLNR